MTSTSTTLTALLDEAAHSDIDDFLAIAEEALRSGAITTTAGETVWTAEAEGLTSEQVRTIVRDEVRDRAETLDGELAADVRAFAARNAL